MASDGDDILDGVRFETTRSDPTLTPLNDLARAMAARFGYTAELSLDPRLAELLRLRVAQLDACAYCLVLHGRVAVRIGIPADAVAALPAWRESDLFSPAERAALRYCEALTRSELTAFPAAHEDLRGHFDDVQVAEIAGVVINMAVWTRLKLAQGPVPTAEPGRDASGATRHAATSDGDD